MEIKRYIALIRKSWWIVALVTFLAVLTAYGISKATTPIFRATATLLAGASVSGNGNATQYIALTQGGLLNSYAAQLTAPPLAQQVSEDLKLDIPPLKLESEIKVAPVNQNLTILVEVDDPDGNRAQAIANKLTDLFVRQQQQQTTNAAAVLGSQNNTVLVSVISPATQAVLIRPKTKLNVVVGAVLGVIVGTLLVFAIDWLDDTVRTPEEAETLLDTRTLAVIPRIQTARGHKETAAKNGVIEESMSSLSRS
ncbi:MAG: YveK family protein [Chloroflexota bacterium]